MSGSNDEGGPWLVSPSPSSSAYSTVGGAAPSKPSRKIVSSSGGGCWSSNAPMSAASPDTRKKPSPRWSNSSAATLLPASIAGLPAPSAWVAVAPPLIASGSSSGSAASVSAGSVIAGSALTTRLFAPLTVGIADAPKSAPVGAVLPDSSVLSRSSVLAPVPPSANHNPPPPLAAVLNAIVLLVRVVCRVLTRPPPFAPLVLPENVLFAIVRVVNGSP